MTTAIIQSYLFFPGTCEQAVNFYREALGAEVEMMMRFKDAPEQPPPGTLKPGYENKVMHASFRIGRTSVMASDGCGDEGGMSGFSLSIAVESIPEAERVFNALSKGGEVQMPLTETFWSPKFGMLKDRFGVSWMVNVIGKH